MPLLNVAETEPITQTHFSDSWVVEQIQLHTTGSVGLTFIPTVVLELPPTHRESAKRAIVRAAVDGLIELRPDGGLGRFTQLELDAAPAVIIPGMFPDGTRWLWARVLDSGSGVTK